MDFKSLSLLREEAKRKREQTYGRAGAAGAGEKRDSLHAGEPEKKKSRIEDARTTELLMELQHVKTKNAEALKSKQDEDAKTEESEDKGATEAGDEVEDDETRKQDIEVMLKLRQFGQPICLFAETAKQRLSRLKALEEQMKEKMTDAELRVLTNIDKAEELRKKREKEKESAATAAALKAKEGSTEGDKDDESHKKTEKEHVDKNCKEEIVRKYLKGLLKQWEAEFAEKSSKEFLESHRGQLAAVTLKQCKESVSYLFDLLRLKTVPKDVVDHLDRIVEFMKKREYVLATDEYLRLAIGNAPWPMGVTMVGIHERAGRERIFSNKVARLLTNTLSCT